MAGMQGELQRAAAPVNTTTRCANFEAAKRYRDQAALFMVQGRFVEAETCSRAALRLWPDDVDTLNELGVAVSRQGRLAEAEAIYVQACQIEPNNSRILSNLGLALSNQGRIGEAGDCYRRILRFEPEAVGAMMNLGISLMHAGEYDEALDLLWAAHKLRPNSVDILHNLGTNLARQGRLHEAIDCYEQALRQSPVCPEVHRNLAYALLSCGNYARGWPEHEWRLLCKDCTGYKVNRAFWNGDNLEGRTILLHGEQGHGDVLQFIRFAPMVKERMGRVLVVCPPPLLQLVARCKGVDMAFASGSYEPQCHVHAPLLSLPAIFGTTLETLPAQVPYLVTDKVLVDHWRVEIAKAIDHDQSIYERALVKRGGADFVSRASRTSPSPSASVDLAHLRPVRGRGGRATRNTSSEPEAEGDLPPSMPAVYEA